MQINTKQVISTVAAVLSVGLALTAASVTVIAKLHDDSQLLFIFLGLLAAVVAAAASLLTARELKARRLARRVFIAYAHKDAEVATRLAKALSHAGFRPWLDREQLLPGQRWREEIMRALSESSAAIAILSQNMEESEVAKQELSLLLERLRSGDIRATAVFPVRIDDSELPPELKKFQWVDLRNEGAEARLIRGMASAISPY